MCGRYSSSLPPSLIAERFQVTEVATDPLPDNHNVAPTSDVYAVLERDGVRQLRAVRWGLVPSWAKDLRIGQKMINARAETVATKPAYKRALARHRCLIPADGYYEWMAQPGKGKQPFFIRHRDGTPLAFAGMWEVWRDPADPAAPPLWSCTIVTTDANSALRQIHDRMPVVLAPAHWDEWLDPAQQDLAAIGRLLGPAPAADFEAYPVSTAVNSVRNKGADLTQPVPPEVSIF